MKKGRIRTTGQKKALDPRTDMILLIKYWTEFSNKKLMKYIMPKLLVYLCCSVKNLRVVGLRAENAVKGEFFVL